MMRQFSHTALFSLIAMGAVSMAPLCFAQQPDSSSSPQSRELARRQAAVRDARQAVQEARLAYQAKRYSQAVEHYRSALASLPDAPATRRFSQFIKDSLSDALIAKAIDYRAVGRAEEAVSFLQEAVELSPKNQRAKVELVYTSDSVRTNPALTPAHVGDVEEVNRLLTLAQGYLDLGKFDEAITTFQSVAKYDAYNAAAQRGVEQATKQKALYYAAARDANRASRLAEVDKLWEEPLPDIAPKAIAEANVISSGIDVELQDSYAKRLEEMVMPAIVFDEASILDVIQALQNQISRFESSGVRSDRHINITPSFGAPDSAGYKDLMSRTISLNLSQVSVKDVLDMLASQLGITYYYVPSGVEISYSGRDFGPMIERTFNVPPHFFDPTKDDQGDSSGDDEDDAFAESGSSMKIRRVNPAQTLKDMGVSFPEGATARYSPSTRQLHVRNTAYNLEQIQDLLNVPLETDRQIVLNVMVMEVSENDLEQLGFDWMFNFNFSGVTTVAGGVEQAASSATGMPVFKGELQPTDATPSATEGLRNGSEAFSGINGMDRLISQGSVAQYSENRMAKAPAIFGLRGVWNAADVTVLMRGLSQKKGVDILQNPRLVLTPGAEEQVTFANVTELFFPETWEAGQVTASRNSYAAYNSTDYNTSNSAVATGAMPSDFVRFGMTEDSIGGVGTILQVHSAEISENGRYVTLALTTTTNDFEGFINWGSPINSALWSGDDKIQFIELTPNYILQPMIKRYVENTKITVVPGSVLVMGGLKEAKYIRYEDKVPMLGDLPLVGRFFRSEGEEKVRKALIYFARVDVVDPTGRDVATGERPSMATDNF